MMARFPFEAWVELDEKWWECIGILNGGRIVLQYDTERRVIDSARPYNTMCRVVRYGQ